MLVESSKGGALPVAGHVENPSMTKMGVADRSADQLWLQDAKRPAQLDKAPVVSVADLFSGCGGMTLGLHEAARRASARLTVLLAADSSQQALDVYSANFSPAMKTTEDLAVLFAGHVGDPSTAAQATLKAKTRGLDILVGGPPCQGHSDLNNRSRRGDPRNSLYEVMARAAEVLGPKVVVIENVPSVRLDKSKVVEATVAGLERAGYKTEGRVLDALELGVPQRRKRYVLIGSRVARIQPFEVFERLSPVKPYRSVAWAIRDLRGRSKKDAESELDKPTQMSAENVRRIAYLRHHRIRDLPDAERPVCHRDGHSYKSMYGRLEWDKPAQTITTGFTSMGQGRYVHPSLARTLTPHEAARIQTFPDWFEWGATTRTPLSTMIGNAVPPFLMMAVAAPLIDDLLAQD